MTLDEIKAVIPHRPPFLWLEKVTGREEMSITAEKFLPADLDLFAGHYPQLPVLPGVIQLEMCFQAGAVLIALNGEPADIMPVVGRVNKVKFKRLIRPEETCEIKATITEHLVKRRTYFLNGSVKVDGETACQCEFVVTGVPREGV